MQCFILNGDERNIDVLNSTISLDRQWHRPWEMISYPTLVIKRPKPSSSRLQKHFNNRNLKCWGKGRNRLVHHLYLVWYHMHIYFEIMLRKGIFQKICNLLLKHLRIFNETIPTNSASSLGHRHVNHKKNNIESGQLHMNRK